MKKRYKILIGIFVLLGLTMVFPPKKNEGKLNLKPFISETNPSEEVQTILKKACYDCHSNQTKYPAYYSYPVINYWIARHIDQGKERLNFSEWENYNKNQKKFVLEQCVKDMKKGKMPMKTYVIKHPEAKLSKEQIDLVVKWMKTTI